MNVHDTINFPNNPDHFIEFGDAGFDPNVESIRRRKNNHNGTFDPFSSSEIPINGGFIDIGVLICECLKRDKIPVGDMVAIYQELLLSAARLNIPNIP